MENKKYKWVGVSNDKCYEEESKTLFSTKKECYDDMRNEVLEKMKWNTNYDEDFGKLDSDGNPVDFSAIGYEVLFSPNEITHKSYSGEYKYKIIETSELHEKMEKLISELDYFSEYISKFSSISVNTWVDLCCDEDEWESFFEKMNYDPYVNFDITLTNDKYNNDNEYINIVSSILNCKPTYDDFDGVPFWRIENVDDFNEMAKQIENIDNALTTKVYVLTHHGCGEIKNGTIFDTTPTITTEIYAKKTDAMEAFNNLKNTLNNKYKKIEGVSSYSSFDRDNPTEFHFRAQDLGDFWDDITLEEQTLK